MLIALVCLLLAVGLVLAVVWRNEEVVTPWVGTSPSQDVGLAEWLRRYLWYAALVVNSALIAGILVVGAGGRLVMRLLAITANEAAQGRITEADEVVGRITKDGTIGFLIFNGILTGLFMALIYVFIRHWLPRGVWKGAIFGALLLITSASRLDPLRADNPDFDIVGPGWVAIVAFVVLGIAAGMCMAAVMGRLSRGLPLLSRRPATFAPYVFLLPPPPVLAVAGGTVAAMLAYFARPVIDSLDSTKVLFWGRIAIAIGTAALLPGFVSAVIDIARSG